MKNNRVLEYSQDDLSSLDDDNISNYYVAKIKPGKHSLIVPLGAKAKITLIHPELEIFKNSNYTIRITDISGVYWEYKVQT